MRRRDEAVRDEAATGARERGVALKTCGWDGVDGAADGDRGQDDDDDGR